MSTTININLSNLTSLSCAQLQALVIFGDQQIEALYKNTLTNAPDPTSTCPRLSVYALSHPDSLGTIDPACLNIYSTQLTWRNQRNLIIQQQRAINCFQII